MLARITLGCVVLSAGALASLADEPKETKLKPAFTFSGTHSAIRKERFVVVTGEVAWNELWKEHRGKDAAPTFTEGYQELNVDFDTHYVVAVFTGWCGWCEVTPRQRGDIVIIGYESTVWQTEGGVRKQTQEEKAKEDALAPYAFVVLPRPVKTVIIEEGNRPRLDKPPVWKERSRIPAPNDKK